MGTISPQAKSGNFPSIRTCMEKKLSAFRKFYSATLALKGALDAGEAELLDPIVRERQQCMDIIDRIDAYMREITHDARAVVLPPADEISREIEKVLEEISTLDGECHAAAAAGLGALRQEILRAMGSRQGGKHGGYPAAIPQASRFLDIQL